jgi:hypothetical protein
VTVTAPPGPAGLSPRPRISVSVHRVRAGPPRYGPAARRVRSPGPRRSSRLLQVMSALRPQSRRRLGLPGRSNSASEAAGFVARLRLSLAAPAARRPPTVSLALAPAGPNFTAHGLRLGMGPRPSPSQTRLTWQWYRRPGAVATVPRTSDSGSESGGSHCAGLGLCQVWPGRRRCRRRHGSLPAAPAAVSNAVTVQSYLI